MEMFRLTIDVMLMMFLLIVVGFILRRKKILPEGMSDVTLARLETYVFVPALNIINWSQNCTITSLKENYMLVVYGCIIILIAILVSYPLSKIFIKEDSYQRNIYKYALAFGNYGFLGNFVVLGVFGSEGLFRYSMFTLMMGFVVNSWGIYVLIPGDKKPEWKDILKKVFNPPIIGLILGAILGISRANQYLPGFLDRALNNASNCMGPVAMILAGFVMGGYDMKEMISNKKVYLLSFFRLILIPGIIVSVLKFFFHVDDLTLTLVLVAYGAPMGLNTIVYPATYGGETKTGAAMAMISHTLALFTVPILYLFFIVYL